MWFAFCPRLIIWLGQDVGYHSFWKRPLQKKVINLRKEVDDKYKALTNFKPHFFEFPSHQTSFLTNLSNLRSTPFQARFEFKE